MEPQKAIVGTNFGQIWGSGHFSNGVRGRRVRIANRTFMGLSKLLPLEVQQRYFSFHVMLVAIVSQTLLCFFLGGGEAKPGGFPNRGVSHFFSGKVRDCVADPFRDCSS